MGVSLLFVPLGVGRGFYFATALMAGLLFLGYGIKNCESRRGTLGAERVPLLLAYLTVLFAVLMLDHAPRA